MMTKRYCTEFDLELLDPTGKARASLARFKESEPVPVPVILNNHDRQYYFDDYLKCRSSIDKRHNIYKEYDAEFDEKYGAQGDSFSLTEMEHKIAEYYDNTSVAPTWHPDLLVARDYFLNLIRGLIDRYGYPQIDWSERGVDGTSAALPTMSKKGEFVAETVGASPWRHVYPSLPGQRSRRLKHRVIFQDSVLNVRYIAPVLSGIRKWLVNYCPQYFSSWMNPALELRPRMTHALVYPDAYSVETDYQSCDTHFSLRIACEIVLPVYETLIPDHMTFIKFSTFIEELFWQPLFMGDYLLTGLHNLFSGQPITNDFETIYGVILSLAGLIRAGKLHKFHEIFVQGDDISVLLRGERAARECHDTMVDLSTQAGLIMSLEKCRIGFRNIRFCKMLYYPEGRREFSPFYPQGMLYGAYPGILALNNVVNPESYDSNEESMWGSFLQRLDTCVGAPHFTPLVIRLFKAARDKACDDAGITSKVDWWDRLYGTAWTLKKSPAYQVLVQNHLW